MLCQLNPALIFGVSGARQADFQILRDSTWTPGHHHHPIAQEQCLADVVGDEDHRLMGGRPDRLEEAVHLGSGLCIQRSKGLVHQEHLRVHRQRARQADPHPHAARELMGERIFEVLKLHLGQKAVGSFSCGTARETFGAKGEGDVLPCGQPGKQSWLLEHQQAIRSGPMDRHAV